MIVNSRYETLFSGGAIAAVTVGLYLCSLNSYLLFHVLVEVVTIAIAFSCFILAWNTRGVCRRLSSPLKCDICGENRTEQTC